MRSETNPPPDRASADAKRRRILLVDDDADLRRLGADYLEDNGYWVAEAETGDRGIERLAAEPFDAVIADLVMPGATDGIALARAARLRWPDVPVILISGYGKAAIEAHDEGFCVMLKPFAMEALARELARHCAGASLPPRSR
jgi:DNA-binding NtrC family response regulator